jgi:hypothetical protein
VRIANPGGYTYEKNLQHNDFRLKKFLDLVSAKLIQLNTILVDCLCGVLLVLTIFWIWFLLSKLQEISSFLR